MLVNSKAFWWCKITIKFSGFLCPSYNILKKRKHNVLGTRSVSMFRWKGAYTDGYIRKSYSQSYLWHPVPKMLYSLSLFFFRILDNGQNPENQ